MKFSNFHWNFPVLTYRKICSTKISTFQLFFKYPRLFMSNQSGLNNSIDSSALNHLGWLWLCYTLNINFGVALPKQSVIRSLVVKGETQDQKRIEGGTRRRRTIRNPKTPENSEKFTEPIRYFGFTVPICKTFRFQSVNFCCLR
jgi:hypothetical protein